jgi:hypothetical protein
MIVIFHGSNQTDRHSVNDGAVRLSRVSDSIEALRSQDFGENPDTSRVSESVAESLNSCQ